MLKMSWMCSTRLWKMCMIRFMEKGMMRECHELKGNSYIANWNLQLKLTINMLTSGEPQKKVV